VTDPNTATATLYNNLYVIGYNDKANSNTITIAGQLIKYIRFNTNLLTAGTASQYQVVKRDIQRMNDRTDIDGLLTAYRNKNGVYPAIDSGTYVKGQSFSTWPSWQAALGNELGATLPKDPFNLFYQYPAAETFTCVDAGCLCKSACSDGLDNDGDGQFDWSGAGVGKPADAGCISSIDASESADDNGQVTLVCPTGDQCVQQGANWMCSVCGAGADPTTCFNSTTLNVSYVGDEFATSFLYHYSATAGFAQVNYNLEGVMKEYYKVDSKP
jgi:hypothetical protein